MKTLLILILATACHAGKLIMTEPYPIDTSFPVEQVDRFLNYYAALELGDSGIAVSGTSVKQDILTGQYGSRTKRIFQNSRLEGLKSLYKLLYASLHLNTKEDCTNRWETLGWFLDMGRKLGLPEEDLKIAQGQLIGFTLEVCQDVFDGVPQETIPKQ